jgi:hypothetical protein
MTQTYAHIDIAGQLFAEFGSYMCAHPGGPAFDIV